MSNINIITISEFSSVHSDYNVEKVIREYQKENIPYPKAPILILPKLSSNTPAPTEIEEYTKSLAEYQVLKQEYDKLLNLYEEQENYI